MLDRVERSRTAVERRAIRNAVEDDEYDVETDEEEEEEENGGVGQRRRTRCFTRS